MSSVLINGVSIMSGFEANTSLNRAFAGVALTIGAPMEALPGLLTSNKRLVKKQKEARKLAHGYLLFAEELTVARRSAASASALPTTSRFGFLREEMASFNCAST